MNKEWKYKLINEINQFIQIIHWIEDIQSNSFKVSSTTGLRFSIMKIVANAWLNFLLMSNLKSILLFFLITPPVHASYTCWRDITFKLSAGCTKLFNVHFFFYHTKAYHPISPQRATSFSLTPLSSEGFSTETECGCLQFHITTHLILFNFHTEIYYAFPHEDIYFQFCNLLSS